MPEALIIYSSRNIHSPGNNPRLSVEPVYQPQEFHPDSLGIPYYTFTDGHIFSDDAGTVPVVWPGIDALLAGTADFPTIKRINSRGVLGLDIVFTVGFRGVPLLDTGSDEWFAIATSGAGQCNTGNVLSYLSDLSSFELAFHGSRSGSSLVSFTDRGAIVSSTTSTLARSRSSTGALIQSTGTASGTPYVWNIPAIGGTLSMGLDHIAADITNKRHTIVNNGVTVFNGTYADATSGTRTSTGPATSMTIMGGVTGQVTAFALANRQLTPFERIDFDAWLNKRMITT